MINIVIESGGCRSDIFERKGEVARVALMWLFPSTPPPPAAASDQATEWSVRWQSLPPRARLFSGALTPFALCFAMAERIQMKEKEFVLWEACRVLQRITGLRVNGCSESPCSWTLAVSFLFIIKWPAWKLYAHRSSCEAKQAGKRKARIWGRGLPGRSQHPPVSLSTTTLLRH